MSPWHCGLRGATRRFVLLRKNTVLADTPLCAYSSTGCTGFQCPLAKCHQEGSASSSGFLFARLPLPLQLGRTAVWKRFLTVKVEWAAFESARCQRAVRSSDCPVPQITYSFARLYCNSPTYSPAFRRRSVQSLITDLLLS
jgi:hypothetical protein